MATLKSDNGWTCLATGSPSLRDWVVGPIVLKFRTGAAGFILAHYSTNWHEKIEPLTLRDMPFDDHGHGVRFIGGGSSGVPSNHWSATAVDLNALRHKQGDPPEESFTASQIRMIRRWETEKYPGLVWGGDWNAVDSMHTEFDDIKRFTKANVRDLALQLVNTSLGKRVIAAQPKPVHWEKW